VSLLAGPCYLRSEVMGYADTITMSSCWSLLAQERVSGVATNPGTVQGEIGTGIHVVVNNVGDDRQERMPERSPR
jgi:hypothetical protein